MTQSPMPKNKPAIIALFLVLATLMLFLFSQNPQQQAETVTVVADNPAASSQQSQQQRQLLAPASAQTQVDPWLNGFGYRKPISISGSGTTLTDYQVNVTPFLQRSRKPALL